MVSVPSDKERRMLLRPLLERRPDLAYHDKNLFFRPIGHYWRAIRCAHNRRRYQFKSFILPMFAGRTVFRYWGDSALGDEESERRVDAWSNPERGSVELCELLEGQMLPRIAGITTPEELAKYPRYAASILDAILGGCFNGDFDEAERTVVAYVGFWNSPITLFDQGEQKFVQRPYSIELATEAHRLSEHMQWRMAYLAKLLRTDRSQVPALLHDWESLTVNAFKLHKYWTRTPFPCEERS